MEFGKVAVLDAQGMILGHTVVCGDQVFAKARVLDQADVEALAAGGVQEVYGARLEEGDIKEDSAAADIAALLNGDLVRLGRAGKGRCNLFAARDGVFCIDGDMVTKLNQLDEAITVATLAPFTRVETGQLVATVKIIPFAVSGAVLCKAGELMSDVRPLYVAGFSSKRVGLIISQVAHSKDGLIKKTETEMAARVQSLGGELGRISVVDHNANAISLALNAISPHHDMALVFGASAIVDRGDVVPTAIRQVGGEIIHFGMPVDPGNLLLLAKINQMPVIGVPTCARSPALNGFDIVLERLMADLALSSADIMAMGVGGLLKEIATRPAPREQI